MRESLLVSHSKGVSRVREGEREGDRGMRYIHREEGDRDREQGGGKQKLACQHKHGSIREHICMCVCGCIVLVRDP